MKKIIRQSLLASAMTAIGVVTATTSAFAQAAPVSETVNFTGTVENVCTLDNVVDGTLVGDGRSVLDSDLGTSGSIDVNCTGAATLSVSLPQDNSSTTNLLTTGGTRYRSSLSNSQGIVIAEKFDQGVNPPGSWDFNSQGPVNETMSVDVNFGGGENIPVGIYNYNVIVTATPN